MESHFTSTLLSSLCAGVCKHKHSALASSTVSVLTGLPLAKPLVYLCRHKLLLCPSKVDHQYTTFSSPLYQLYSYSAQHLLSSHYHFVSLPTTIPNITSSTMDSSDYKQSFTGNNPTPTSDLMITSSTLYQPSSLYKGFLNDPTSSDVTIRFGGKRVYAHRAVLCRGSEYFAKMLTGQFQVSSMLPFPPNEGLRTNLNNRSQHARRSNSTVTIRMRSLHFCVSCTTFLTTPKPTRSGSPLCIRTLKRTWWPTSTRSDR
jgi:hypothetical protein